MWRIFYAVEIFEEQREHVAGVHLEMGFGPLSSWVESLAVVRSEMGPGGLRYTVCSRQHLRGRAAGLSSPATSRREML